MTMRILIVATVLVLFITSCSLFDGPQFKNGDQIYLKTTGEKGKVFSHSKKKGDYLIKLESGSRQWVDEEQLSSTPIAKQPQLEE